MKRLILVASLALPSCKTTPADPAPAPARAAKPVEVARVPVAPSDGAQQAVTAQLAAIDAGRLDDFRASFTAELRERVTAETLAACRVRVHQVAVRPDWEMAKDTTDASGLRVRAVSMFGKSLTGFHEQRDGRWLADALWCVPVGVP